MDDRKTQGEGEAIRQRFGRARDLSRLTGIPVGTIHAWQSQGRLAHIRLGPRNVLYDLDELVAELLRHRVGPRTRASVRGVAR